MTRLPLVLLQVPVTGWLQAFAAHPRLGRVEATQTTSQGFLQLSKGEQAGVAGAASSILEVRMLPNSMP